MVRAKGQRNNQGESNVSTERREEMSCNSKHWFSGFLSPDLRCRCKLKVVGGTGRGVMCSAVLRIGLNVVQEPRCCCSVAKSCPTLRPHVGKDRKQEEKGRG